MTEGVVHRGNQPPLVAGGRSNRRTSACVARTLLKRGVRRAGVTDPGTGCWNGGGRGVCGFPTRCDGDGWLTRNAACRKACRTGTLTGRCSSLGAYIRPRVVHFEVTGDKCQRSGIDTPLRESPKPVPDRGEVRDACCFFVNLLKYSKLTKYTPVVVFDMAVWNTSWAWRSQNHGCFVPCWQSYCPAKGNCLLGALRQRCRSERTRGCLRDWRSRFGNLALKEKNRTLQRPQ